MTFSVPGPRKSQAISGLSRSNNEFNLATSDSAAFSRPTCTYNIRIISVERVINTII